MKRFILTEALGFLSFCLLLAALALVWIATP